MPKRIALAAACLLAASLAPAATITVNTTTVMGGDGLCSLTEALGSAVTDTVWDADCALGSGADTIAFDPAAFPAGSTITLGSALDIYQASNTTIDGGGRVTLDGGGATPLVTATLAGTTLTLRGLTLAGGNTAGGGPTDGGGIYADGVTLNIDHSVITGNTALANGGGLFSRDSTVTITDSQFTANTASLGGAVYSTGSGSLTVANSRFTGNIAGQQGGALYSGVNTLVTGSIIANNASPAAGGANRGAGVRFSAPAGHTFTLNHNQITDNTPGDNCYSAIPFTGTGNQYWPESDTSCPAAAGRFANPLAPPAAIPVDAPWALALLSALVAALGLHRRRGGV
ncbi:hypothetical protein GmRootA79_23200 [Acidovorax sp. A79]|uniref:right-handed parallel beta-helix repeat-containing protein n=1 Tax=Acidovorax sp. A79 TaxID=3056107 RepID=UPI0034E8E372